MVEKYFVAIGEAYRDTHRCPMDRGCLACLRHKKASLRFEKLVSEGFNDEGGSPKILNDSPPLVEHNTPP